MIRKLTLLLLCILAGPARPQWSSEPAKNTRVTNGGLLPQIISDGSGGAYIVYQDSPALLRQLWVQWLDRYGFVRFPENGIRVSSQERNQTPTYFLVSDSTGGVIVVFRDFQVVNDQTLGAVYTQRIDSSGTKLWGKAGVEVSSPRHSKTPVSACSDGESGVFVFWDDGVDSTEVPELRTQRVNANGELVWPDNGILMTDDFTSSNVAIPNPAVSDGAGGAIVSYSDSNKTKVQRIDSDGNKLWGRGTVVFVRGKMFSKNGGAVLGGRLIDAANNISYRASRVDSGGNIAWEALIEDSLPNSLIPTPGISFNERKETTFAWQEGIDDSAKIYYNKINRGGNLLFSKKIRVSSFPSKQVAPDVISYYDTADQMSSEIIIWYDYRKGNGGLFSLDALFAQRSDENGNRLWSESDIEVSTSEVQHRSFQVVSDLSGGVIVCWYETGAGSGFGIFAQQVSRNGNLGEVLVTSVSQPDKSPIPAQFALHQSYPNPFNAAMIIKYELPQNSQVTLTIHDITGKEVIKLLNKRQAPGQYQVVWNGKNKKGSEVSSGIYFYQLRAGSFVQVKKALFIK